MNYTEQINAYNITKLNEISCELPEFCKIFFRSIEKTTSSRTRIAYAYDLRIFFNYLSSNTDIVDKITIKNVSVSILDKISANDIEEFLQYLKYYSKDEKEYFNDERGIMRKLSTLRSLYKYFYCAELITTNAPSMVSMPKLHEKAIIRLDVDEISILLDEVENGDKLTKSQQKFHNKTKIRDLALLTLLLGTGIRVSECVGLNINDVDFKNCGIKITRKGGYETIIYFGDEVNDALLEYIEQRKHTLAVSGHEDALFLSLQNKRIGVRTVEKLVKKYAALVTTLKKITPHKLRSTYGTNLYKETGDIYLVADVLGHKDVNTTKKHYAAIDEEHKKSARNLVKLREEKISTTEKEDNTNQG